MAKKSGGVTSREEGRRTLHRSRQAAVGWPGGRAACFSGLRAASRRLQARESQKRQAARRAAVATRRRLAAQ